MGCEFGYMASITRPQGCPLVTFSRGVGRLVALLGAVFVAWAIRREWSQVGSVLQDVQPLWLVAALGLAIGAMTGIALAWHIALGMTGAPARVADVLHWYFVGELGKYVPGGVWAVVGRGELAARDGRVRAQAYGSVILSLAATYLCGMGVAVALLLGSGFGELRTLEIGALAVLFLVGIFALHPAVLGRIFSQVSKRWPERFPVVAPSFSSGLGLVAANLPSWLAMGLATSCVAQALGLEVPLGEIMLATALSWVLGFLVIPAPGGMGVREAVFTLTVGSLSGGGAAAVAILARLIFMMSDAVGAAIFTLWSLISERR